MSFTEAFKQLLAQANMSQAEFARLSGFGTSYVSQLCAGKVSDPSITKAGIIAKVFGISVQELYDLSFNGK